MIKNDINSQKSMLFSRQSIRSALKLWHDLAKLNQHPLADLHLVLKKSQSDEIPDRGKALREVLHESILRLKPDLEKDDKARWTDKKWRRYLIVTEQYLKNVAPEPIAERMGIVIGTYHQEQAQALDELAFFLLEQEQYLDLQKTPVFRSELHLQAVECFSDFKEQAAQTQDWCVFARACLGIARSAFSAGQINQAIQNCEQGLNATKKMSVIADSQYWQSELFVQLAAIVGTCGDYARAHYCLTEVLRLPNHNPLAIHSAFVGLGIMAYWRGDCAYAQPYFENALKLAEECNSVELLVSALSLIGGAAIGLGQYEQAQQHLSKANHRLLEVGYVNSAGYLYLQLGQLSQNLGRFHQAETFYKQGLKVLTTYPNMIYNASLLIALANLSIIQENIEQAQEFAQQAFEIGELAQFLDAIIPAQAILGFCACLQNDNSGKNLLDSALLQAKQLQRPWLIMMIHLLLGHVLLIQQNFETSCAMFDLVVNQASQVHAVPIQGEALFGLAQARSASGDSVQAKIAANESLALLAPIGHYLVKKIEFFA